MNPSRVALILFVAIPAFVACADDDDDGIDLTFGDDSTDEDTTGVLPETGTTILETGLTETDTGIFTESTTLESTGSETAGADFELTSPAFASGDALPDQYTCEGQEFGLGDSPELDWTPGPDGTLSYAIVLVDLSLVETLPERAYHWAAWDIPATATSLPEAIPAGQTLAGLEPAQQRNGGPGEDPYAFFAPCPSWATFCDPKVPPVTDSYAFILYALDEEVATVPAFPDKGSEENYIRLLGEFFAGDAIGSAELEFTTGAVPTALPFACPEE